ncbi:MAG TPA: cadherin-like beta sandwich domain-containing protein [Gaiellaceae bacterium]|jgi:hypothetical protein|nr:cadherin-like beta sandwich domain-containing protein [Gaiellaceae bacterium]
MRRRAKLGLRTFGAMAAVTGVAVVGGSVARAGSTITVCASGCSQTTIQAAVDAAGSGDTIQVSAGTYAEDVTVAKPVTLEGVQAGPTKVRSITITGSGVTVDGFTFTSSGVQVSVSSPTTLSGLVIRNNVFNGYSGTGLTTYDAGDILVKGNTFSSASGSAEAMQIRASTVTGGCSGSQVLDNTFSSATTNGSADVNFSCTGSSSSDVTVSGNTTSGNSGGSSFAAFSGVTDGIEVSDNSGTTDGSSIFFWGAVSGTATIEGNTLTSTGGSGVSIHGHDLNSDPVNTGTFTISDNDLAGSSHAVYVLNGTVVAHGNKLSGGLGNDSGATVDATRNWWGAQAGPGTVTGVTTSPWCTNSTCGFTSDSADLGSLSLSAGSLSPAFSASTTSYAATVDNATSAVSVTAAAGPGATVVTTGGSSLAVGANTVEVTVTSLDGAHTKTYTVTVTRVAASSGGGTTTTTATSTTTTTPTTTTSQPTQAATVVNQPQSAEATPATAGTVAVVVAPTSAGNAGPAVPVSVALSWSPGAFTQPVTVQVSPQPEAASAPGAPEAPKPVAGGFAVGSTVVQVQVTTESGQAVTQFAAPLVLHVSALAPGEVPAYSHDGSSWTTIPRLTSDELPAGQADGYFVNPDGSVDILTRHATLFGLLVDTQAPSRPTVHARVTGTKLRLTIHAKDNVRVVSYQVRLDGKLVKRTTHAYVVLPAHPGRYQVVAVDAAGHKSARASAPIRVMQSGRSLHLAG